jgi:hypothetical protein
LISGITTCLSDFFVSNKTKRDSISGILLVILCETFGKL